MQQDLKFKDGDHLYTGQFCKNRKHNAKIEEYLTFYVKLMWLENSPTFSDENSKLYSELHNSELYNSIDINIILPIAIDYQDWLNDKNAGIENVETREEELRRKYRELRVLYMNINQENSILKIKHKELKDKVDFICHKYNDVEKIREEIKTLLYS
jgi:hypothetical protein